MRLDILDRIRKHLQEHPGEYRWNPIAGIMKVDPIEFYDHLKWLRESGFTHNDRGRVYWGDRTVDELYSSFPEQSVVIGHVIKRRKSPKIEVKITVSKSKKEVIPKLEKVYVLNDYTMKTAIDKISKFTFANKTIAEIERLIPGYQQKILKVALIRSGCQVAWLRRSNIAVYSRFKKEAPKDRENKAIE